MKLTLDEDAIRDRLRPVLDDPGFRQGMRNVVCDPLFCAIFLMGLAEGEALGEVGVAAIRQDEIAALIHDLRRQELEEHGHSEGARMVCEELFPQYFDAQGNFQYDHALSGRMYYMTVREMNRTRLKDLDRYSRLNMYMTTSFGYEVMVQLHFQAAIDAMPESTLPAAGRDRVHTLLKMILSQEETHLEMVDQHNALLDADRSGLSEEARTTLDMLDRLTNEDYEWIADVAVREIVPTFARYADAEAYRAEIETGAPAS